MLGCCVCSSAKLCAWRKVNKCACVCVCLCAAVRALRQKEAQNLHIQIKNALTPHFACPRIAVHARRRRWQRCHDEIIAFSISKRQNSFIRRFQSTPSGGRLLQWHFAVCLCVWTKSGKHGPLNRMHAHTFTSSIRTYDERAEQMAWLVTILQLTCFAVWNTCHSLASPPKTSLKYLYVNINRAAYERCWREVCKFICWLRLHIHDDKHWLPVIHIYYYVYHCSNNN